MRFVVLIGCAALCGCSSSSGPKLSADLDTSEIRLTPSLVSNGAVTQVTVSLSDIDHAAVTLSGADRLLLTASGEEATLVAVSGRYVGQLETPAPSSALVLEREGGERITSAIPLPPPFVLSPPADPVSLSQPFTFTWTADAGDFETRISVQSTCFGAIQRTLASDSGQYTIQPADLTTLSPGGGTCDVHVEVSRSWQHGVLAPALVPPEYPPWSAQIRTITFAAAP